MVFKRCQDDYIDINGVRFEVVNAVNQDHFACKENFMNIIAHIVEGFDADSPECISPDNLAGWKKELISRLKDFEKKYVKHAKSTNPILGKIQNDSMQPVTDLCEAGVNLYNFNKLNPVKNYPEFRKKAIYDKFIEHMTKVCDILRGFSHKDGPTLDQEYDIRHIIEMLEIPGWPECPPLAYYLNPLKAAFDDLIDELRKMHKLGFLRISYYCERNKDMVEKIFHLVKQYNIVKVLAGDDLKRDQFKFIYNMHEKVYNCALKDMYLDNKKSLAIKESVVPELTVFYSMLLIKDIDDKKQADIVKKAEKAAERAELGLSEEEEEELKLDIPQPVQKKGKKKV